MNSKIVQNLLQIKNITLSLVSKWFNSEQTFTFQKFSGT